MLRVRVPVPLKLSDPVSLLLMLLVNDAVFVSLRLHDTVRLAVNDKLSARDSELDTVMLRDMLLLHDIDGVILEHDMLRLWLLLVVCVAVTLPSGVLVTDQVGVEQDTDRVALYEGDSEKVVPVAESEQVREDIVPDPVLLDDNVGVVVSENVVVDDGEWVSVVLTVAVVDVLRLALAVLERLKLMVAVTDDLVTLPAVSLLV
mmetsp:Transcript_81670/g.144063  ORF Transcript_81670/g.144063 Transcript_81670/m.144063 type:complete len:203 (+) Transcript_81670:209-817(+)